MESIVANESRVGNFTSSGIVALVSMNRKGDGPGEPFYTYIEECLMEQYVGRTLDSDSDTRATSWGKLVEKRVLEELLGVEYIPCSRETLTHRDFKFWRGTPDVSKDNYETIGDAKCPTSIKSFCQLVGPAYDKQLNIIHNPLTIGAVRHNHKEGDKWYWQLVSNACITGAKYGELIIYCPYKHELNEIRELASNYDGNQNKVAWINWAEDYELPFIPKGKNVKNLNIIRFEIPKEDKQFLTDRVIMAGKLLNRQAA